MRLKNKNINERVSDPRGGENNKGGNRFLQPLVMTQAPFFAMLLHAPDAKSSSHREHG